jgi:hypothetical protein
LGPPRKRSSIVLVDGFVWKTMRISSRLLGPSFAWIVRPPGEHIQDTSIRLYLRSVALCERANRRTVGGGGGTNSEASNFGHSAWAVDDDVDETPHGAAARSGAPSHVYDVMSDWSISPKMPSFSISAPMSSGNWKSSKKDSASASNSASWPAQCIMEPGCRCCCQ